MAMALPRAAALLLAMTALVAGCSGPVGDAPAPASDTIQPDDAGAGPSALTATAGPAAGAAAYGTPATQEFTQTWAMQMGQGGGGLYVLRSPDPAVDMPINATAVLVEARWGADQALPGTARLIVAGPQRDWGAAQGDGDLRVWLPADVGGHRGTLRLDLDEAGALAVGMRATYYVTAFMGGPADPAFTALP